MTLSETGEARVRGYLFVLGRSLRGCLRREAALEALREIEAHLRERLAQVDATPNEQTALERVLAELGSPLRVAQAYSAEAAVDEALATGGVAAVARALWRLATTTVVGFVAGLALFVGYTTGASFVLMAALKPVFPRNVGVVLVNGGFHSFGAHPRLPPGGEVWGGYWVIPVCAVLGLGLLVITHRGARAFLVWWRSRVSGLRSDGLSLR